MGTEETVKTFAHRGLHQGNPAQENTKEAVRDALESSADGMEVDLQLLGDGHFLLYHDDVIRTKGAEGSVQPKLLNAIDYQEARRVLGNNCLTLEEVLDWDWRDKEIIFECKPARNNFSLVRRLKKRLKGSDPLPTVSSSDLRLLQGLLRETTLPVIPVITDINPLLNGLVEKFEFREIHLYEPLCTKKKLLRLDGCEPENVIAWTVNTKKRRQELERLGIKGIMTDNVELLR